MSNMVFLDFEQYAEQFLSAEDREILNGVEVEVYIDIESKQLGSAIYCDKFVPAEQYNDQDRILKSFFDQLRTDRTVQSWLTS